MSIEKNKKHKSKIKSINLNMWKGEEWKKIAEKTHEEKQTKPKKSNFVKNIIKKLFSLFLICFTINCFEYEFQSPTIDTLENEAVPNIFKYNEKFQFVMEIAQETTRKELNWNATWLPDSITMKDIDICHNYKTNIKQFLYGFWWLNRETKEFQIVSGLSINTKEKCKKIYFLKMQNYSDTTFAHEMMHCWSREELGDPDKNHKGDLHCDNNDDNCINSWIVVDNINNELFEWGF